MNIKKSSMEPCWTKTRSKNEKRKM